MRSVFPPTPTSTRAILLALCGVLLLVSVLRSGARPPSRNAPPTTGWNSIESPASIATISTVSMISTSSTPRPRRSGHGPRGQAPPGSRRHGTAPRSVHDPLQPRDVETWALFGVLVVGLGVVTIRMLRLPRFHALKFERLEFEDLA